jgi:hypothetical protein
MAVLTIRNGAFVPGTTQNITTSGSAQASNAVGNTSSIIRVTCQQDTYVALGSAPTATANSMIILGGSTEYMSVEPGTTIVSVLQVSSAGIVSITELTGY